MHDLFWTQRRRNSGPKPCTKVLAYSNDSPFNSYENLIYIKVNHPRRLLVLFSNETSGSCIVQRPLFRNGAGCHLILIPDPKKAADAAKSIVAGLVLFMHLKQGK